MKPPIQYQKWVCKNDFSKWAEVPLAETLRDGDAVYARFYHESGQFLRGCYVPANYIRDEFVRAEDAAKEKKGAKK